MKEEKKLINGLKNFRFLIESLEEKERLIKELEMMIEGVSVDLKLSEDKEIETNIFILKKSMLSLKREKIKIITKINLIKALIAKTPETYSKILKKRYIEGRSMKSIAKSEHYSFQRIYQLHDKGIKELLRIKKRLDK